VELRNQVMSAGSASERAALLSEAGVTVPTHADINEAHANMTGVDGAGALATVGAIAGGAQMGAGVAAAGAVAF
jgi:hypothetical protein